MAGTADALKLMARALLPGLVLGSAPPSHAAPTEPPVVSASASPIALLNWLYLDLAELAGPRTGAPPIWWEYLSADTKRLHDRLQRLASQNGCSTFDFDWMCQCKDRRKIKIPPNISIETRTEEKAVAHVAVKLYGGSVERVQLILVKENGWKIDDIVNESGNHFRAELVRGIEDYERGRKPLTRQLPD